MTPRKEALPTSVRIDKYTLEGKKGVRTYVNGVPLSRKPVDVERAVQQAEALKKGGDAKEIQAYALSESDMRKVIPTLKILSYTDLLDSDSIDDVLDDKGRLMLLYLTENESTGHWVCLLKLRDSNIIEYFDPYSNYKPDGEKKWLSAEKLREFGQDTDHLTKMLKNSPYTVKSNAVPFQQDKNNMNTCGRHCLVRLYLKHLSLPEYATLVEDACEEGGITPDDFVSGFSYNMIQK
jgi:hypothetical protein